MTRLSWHLEIINHDGIEKGLFGGDRLLNTTIENFFTLQDVWSFLGFRLKKQRFGYSGIKGNKEYILTRYSFF